MNTELEIDGTKCGHCLAAVKRAVEAPLGVESADVGRDFAQGSAERGTLGATLEEEDCSVRGA